MRETELWSRLNQALGEAYARTWADQLVLSELSSRTVNEALAAGVPPKAIWRAVWTHLELEERQR